MTYADQEGMSDRLHGKIEKLEAEITRLKRGDFTEEEFQNLCHNLSEKVEDECKFKEGCIAYQKKLFGDK